MVPENTLACWAQCRALKQQEGAFLITQQHSLLSRLLQVPLHFSPDGTCLNLLSWSTGDSHPSPSVPPDSRVPTWQHIPSRDVLCAGSWALRSNCGTAALQEGTKWQILLMAWALIFLMAAGSDSPFLSHSSWHCHTYLTALSPPLSLYQILPPSFAWDRAILFGGLFFILPLLISAWQEAISCCSAPKCHLSVELQSQFASLLPTPCCFAWL